MSHAGNPITCKRSIHALTQLQALIFFAGGLIVGIVAFKVRAFAECESGVVPTLTYTIWCGV